jgi:hypothetical protein
MEVSMRFRNTTALLALLCSSGAAPAGYLNLSGAQEQLIYQTLKKVKVQNPPDGCRPAVGDKLPPTFTTSKLPQHITDRVPTTRTWNMSGCGAARSFWSIPSTTKWWTSSGSGERGPASAAYLTFLSVFAASPS